MHLASLVLVLLAWPLSFYRVASAEYRFGSLLQPGDPRGDPKWWAFRARRLFATNYRGRVSVGVGEYQSLAPERAELDNWKDYDGWGCAFAHGKPISEPLVYWRAPDDFMFLGLGVTVLGSPTQGARAVSIPHWGAATVLAAGVFLLWRPAHRRARRAANNQCIGCGYSLAGVAPGSPCPECGTVACTSREDTPRAATAR